MPSHLLHAVIPAGGSGTRLWPLSRADHPKFLHALTGSSASLLQATFSRLAPLAGPETTYVVTGTGHAAAVARQLPDLPEANLLVEPSPRDSCAAIGLAAAVIARRHPGAIMGSFAADHLVRDEAGFVAAIRAAVVGASAGRLMAVGITPTYPETGYGYLYCGEAIGIGDLRTVAEFKEKPSADLAAAYLASGQYLWNASMFVWRVEVFLAELSRQRPALFGGLTRIAEAWDTPEHDAVLGEVWPGLPKVSVDHAVMEGAAEVGLVATVPGGFGWADIGDFHTLGDVLAETGGGGSDPDRNVIVAEPMAAPVLLRDTHHAVVVAHSGRLVAALGVTDLIIVDTPDSVLVCARDRAQDVKALVDRLKELGEDRYL